jgi:hypothetical protein
VRRREVSRLQVRPARRRVLDVRRQLDPWRNTDQVQRRDRQPLAAWL